MRACLLARKPQRTTRKGHARSLTIQSLLDCMCAAAALCRSATTRRLPVLAPPGACSSSVPVISNNCTESQGKCTDLERERDKEFFCLAKSYGKCTDLSKCTVKCTDLVRLCRKGDIRMSEQRRLKSSNLKPNKPTTTRERMLSSCSCGVQMKPSTNGRDGRQPAYSEWIRNA